MKNNTNVIIMGIILLVLLIIFIPLMIGSLKSEFSGNSGVPDTIEIVIPKGTYEEQVNAIADQLTNPDFNISGYQRYQIIHDWVASYLDYNYDALEDMELLRKCNDPEYCLDTSWAVCGGYANLFKDICNAANLSCVYVSGRADLFDQGNIGHAWNAVKADNNYYHIDVCWDDYKLNDISYDWFMQGNGYVTNSFREWSQSYNFSTESYPITRSKIESFNFKTIKE